MGGGGTNASPTREGDTNLNIEGKGGGKAGREIWARGGVDRRKKKKELRRV